MNYALDSDGLSEGENRFPIISESFNICRNLVKVFTQCNKNVSSANK